MLNLSRTQLEPIDSPKRPTKVVAAALTPPFLVRPAGLQAPAHRSDPRRVGPYRILRKLGEGGMGAVYLSYDAARRHPVAVKVLAPEHAAVPNYLARFRQEGRHGAALNHPHLV